MSYDLDLVSAQSVVAAAGVAEPLITGIPGIMRTRLLIIKALTTNAGKVYVSNHTVSNTTGLDLDPGDVLILSVDLSDWDKGDAINLTMIWLDVDNNGEGVIYTYRRE